MLKYTLIALFVVILGLTGNMDYQDTVKDEQYYTNMVCDGYWANYRNLEIDCDKHTDTSTKGNR